MPETVFISKRKNQNKNLEFRKFSSSRRGLCTVLNFNQAPFSVNFFSFFFNTFFNVITDRIPMF